MLVKYFHFVSVSKLLLGYCLYLTSKEIETFRSDATVSCLIYDQYIFSLTNFVLLFCIGIMEIETIPATQMDDISRSYEEITNISSPK